MYSLYEMIGVERNASQKDITRAIRALYKATHPDKVGDNSTVHLFELAVEADKKIGNPKSRVQYDKTLDDYLLEPFNGREISHMNIGHSFDKKDIKKIDPMVMMGSVATTNAILSQLKKNHMAYREEFSESPGVIAIDPLHLVRGGNVQQGFFSCSISPGTKPGDKIDVTIPNGMKDSMYVTVENPNGHVFYSNGEAVLVSIVDPIHIANNTEISCDYNGEKFTFSPPPCSGGVFISDAGERVKVLGIDSRISDMVSDPSFMSKSIEFVSR